MQAPRFNTTGVTPNTTTISAAALYTGGWVGGLRTCGGAGSICLPPAVLLTPSR
jgi:hypothetical protein